MYCSKCGNELKETDLFCNKCGTKIEDNINTSKINGEVDKKNIQSKWKQILIPIIISAIVILGSSLLLFLSNYNKKTVEKEYNDNLIINNTTDTKKSVEEEIEEKIKNLNFNIENPNDDEMKTIFNMYLSNHEWVKDNLYLKKDYEGKVISEHCLQQVKFAQYNDTNTNIHLGFTLVEEYNNNTRKCSVLVYKNGKVTIQEIEGWTSKDIYKVDTEKKVIYKRFLDTDTSDIETILFEIYGFTDSGIVKIGYLEEKYNLNSCDNVGNYIPISFKQDGNVISKEKYNNIKNKYIDKDDLSDFKIIKEWHDKW